MTMTSILAYLKSWHVLHSVMDLEADGNVSRTKIWRNFSARFVLSTNWLLVGVLVMNFKPKCPSSAGRLGCLLEYCTYYTKCSWLHVEWRLGSPWGMQSICLTFNRIPAAPLLWKSCLIFWTQCCNYCIYNRRKGRGFGDFSLVRISAIVGKILSCEVLYWMNYTLRVTSVFIQRWKWVFVIGRR